MATVEELHFNLIVDDKDFNAQVEAAQKKAEALGVAISSAFNFSGGASGGYFSDLKKLQLELEKSVQERLASGKITKEQAEQELRAIKIQLQEKMAAYKMEAEALKNQEALRHQSQMAAQAEARDLAKTQAQAALASEKQRVAEQKRVSDAVVNAEKEAAAKQKTLAAEIAKQNAEKKGVLLSQQQEILEIKKETAKIRQAQAQERMNKAQEQGNKILERSAKIWQELKGLAAIYFSVQGAERLLKNLVLTSAEFEKQRISLEAILHDVNGADAIFEKIKQLAVVSPFSFKELVTYTKQLSAFSIPMNELYDTTKMLADVSAGLGISMDRLILAYGQIRSASFLRGLSNIPGLSASKGVKKTNSLNCWNLSTETISSQAFAFA